MSISSVSGATAFVPQAESGEATAGGHDVQPDGDADDGAVSQAPSAPAPSASAPQVNSIGQTVGTVVNTQA